MMPPAGWYPDPQQPGLQRWWDGTQWTGQPVATPQQPLYGTPASASGTPPTGYSTPYAAPYGAPPATAWTSPTSQWGAPTPGGYYYAQPKKRGRRWWTIFGVVALCVLTAVGVGVGFLVKAVIDDVYAPRQVASHYLTDLRDGAYASAYARLCVADQEEVTPTRFATSKAAVHPTSFAIVTTSFADTNGSRSAVVTYSETSSDGSQGTHSLALVRQGTAWKVCHPGEPASDWADVPTGGGASSLPAAFRAGATRLSHSY